MRLWSLHPKHLDARGLVALWREALLARAVLHGRTRGYRHHPQLRRFRDSGDPRAQIDAFLRAVLEEAEERGYSFDARKIGRARATTTIPVTRGQIRHEWEHLRRKLARRDRAWLAKLVQVKRPATNPVFRAVPGRVEEWEVVEGARRSAHGLRASPNAHRSVSVRR